jgi:hypothetical protein
MKPLTTYTIIFAVLLLLFLVVGDCVFAQEDACVAVAKLLVQKKRQRGDYVEALKKLKNEKDTRLLEVLNFKIGDLSDQIAKLETELGGLPGGHPPPRPQCNKV